MATTNDSGGLVDRRSLREVAEQAVGGSKAPISAKEQLANTARKRQMQERQDRVIKRSANRRGKLSG